MLRTTAITKELAVIERKLQETTNQTLKDALKKKQARLKDELNDFKKSTPALAKQLLAQRTKIKQLSKVDFNDLIRRLSKKPEYSFLRTMSKSTIKTDIERPAKPVGWRFKGRGNYDKPTAAEIKKGKRNGTVYREVRPLRSDVSQPLRLETGGVIGQEIVFDDNGEQNTGVIKDIHEITGDYVISTDDGRTVLASKELDVISLGKMRKQEAKKRFSFFENGGNLDSMSLNQLLDKVPVFERMHIDGYSNYARSKESFDDLVKEFGNKRYSEEESRQYDNFKKRKVMYENSYKQNVIKYLQSHKMENGGNIEKENNEMLHSQAKEAKHHIEELHNILTSKTKVEPWVVAKMTRAKTDLSDITHYLDGNTSKMAKGGKLTDAQQEKFDKVMHEWKQGKLHSGSSNGPIVKDQDQAIAIAYSEAYGMKKMAFGGMIDEDNVSTGAILRMEELSPSETLEEFIANAQYITTSLIEEGFEKDEILTFLAHMMVNNVKGEEISQSISNIKIKPNTKYNLLELIGNKDDAEIIVNGKAYTIYNPNNGNLDNTEMWGYDTIKALDENGDEYRFKYSEIDEFRSNVNDDESSYEWTMEDANALIGWIMDIQDGFGWITPGYVEDSWTSRPGSGTKEWNGDIQRRVYQELIDENMLFAENPNDSLKKGKKIKDVTTAIWTASEENGYEHGGKMQTGGGVHGFKFERQQDASSRAFEQFMKAKKDIFEKTGKRINYYDWEQDYPEGIKAKTEIKKQSDENKEKELKAFETYVKQNRNKDLSKIKFDTRQSSAKKLSDNVSDEDVINDFVYRQKYFENTYNNNILNWIINDLYNYYLQNKSKYTDVQDFVVKIKKQGKLKEYYSEGGKMQTGGGVDFKAEYVTTILGETPAEDEGYWENYNQADFYDLNPNSGRYEGYTWVSMEGEKGYWEKSTYANGGGVDEINVGDKVIITTKSLGNQYEGMLGEITPTKLLNNKFSIKLENGLTMAFDKGEFRHNSINPKYSKGGGVGKKPKSIIFLEQTGYYDRVADSVKGEDKEDDIIGISDWLNDLDKDEDLGSNLMSHAKSAYNYIIKDKGIIVKNNEPESETLTKISNLSSLNKSLISEWANKNNIDLSMILTDLKSKKIRAFDLQDAVLWGEKKYGKNYSKENFAKYSKMSKGGNARGWKHKMNC